MILTNVQTLVYSRELDRIALDLAELCKNVGKNKTSWIVNKLSIDQMKIDHFAQSFSNGVGKYLGQSAIVCVVWLVICVIIMITISANLASLAEKK